MNTLKRNAAIALVLTTFCTAPAHALTPTHLLAYADPGSGAMLWQIILSSGAILVFYVGRVKHWWSRMFHRNSSDAAKASEQK